VLVACAPPCPARWMWKAGTLSIFSRSFIFSCSLSSWLSLTMEVEHKQSRTPLQPCLPRLSHPTSSTATASTLANLTAPCSLRTALRPCRHSSPSPAAAAEQLQAAASRAMARGRRGHDWPQPGPGHPLPSTGWDPEATATGAPAATVAVAVRAAAHMARWL
jgi:hypothetical protein